MVSGPDSDANLSKEELLERQKKDTAKERKALQEKFRDQMMEAIRLLHPEKAASSWSRKDYIKWLQDALDKRFPNHVVPPDQDSAWPVKNWFDGKNIPEMTTLIAISDILHQSIDWLLGQPTSFPQMVVSRERYDACRSQCLQSSYQEVWIQLTTGATFPAEGIGLTALTEAIHRSQAEKRGFKLCVLVTSPEDNEALDMILRRRESGGSRATIATTIKATIGNFINLALSAKLINFQVPATLANLEIIQVPYIAPVTNIIADPYDAVRGRMVLLQPNFRRIVYDAPAVEFFKKDHQALFDWYVQDFKRMREWALQPNIEGVDPNIHGPVDLADFQRQNM